MVQVVEVLWVDHDLSDVIDVVLKLVNVDEGRLDTVLLVTPDGDGDFGVPVHGQVEGVPLQDQLLGLQLVMALVHKPDQLGGDGWGL